MSYSNPLPLIILSLIIVSIFGIISLYFSLIKKSNNKIILIISLIFGLLSIVFGIYSFNAIDYFLNNNNLGNGADVAKEIASVKTMIFVLIGAGIVNLYSAFKLAKN